MDTREVNRLINEAAKNISSIAPGTTIPHLSMGELLGVQRHADKEKYYNMVGKLKKELQSVYGLFLRTETKIGYSIVMPGDEIDLCLGEFNAGKKKMWRATARTSCIRIDNIIDDAKRAQTISKAQKMANILGLLRFGQDRQMLAHQKLTI